VADFSIKRGDTAPPLVAVLRSEGGTALDLSDVTSVAFKMRPATGVGSAVTGSAAVVDALAGKVAYSWRSGDTAVIDLYWAEFEIRWNSGEVQTVPSDEYIEVRVLADLG
jgi:hypothetical protein